VILFDIGGGSSEVIRLDRDPANPGAAPKISGWVSLPLGVVTLAERHGGTEVTAESYGAMVEEVSAELRPFAQAHGGNLDGMHLLGTSGTVTTVAGIFLNLPRYDRRRVDGIWMNEDNVTRTVWRLRDMSYQERVNNACIGTERGDLVLAGCAILDAIRAAFPCPRLRIADRGLREGMLVQMMREDGVLRAS
jgi:exopolyphosphatase/guanosine-5'-triphosphate,3'-diphosphate pyrophosphatase